MKRTLSSRFALTALAFASSSLAFACGSNDSSTSTSTESASAAQLDETNGGIKPGNESAAFGDTNIESLTDVATTYTDSLDTTGGFSAVETTTDTDASAPTDPITSADGGTTTGTPATAYHLAIFWGHLPAARDSSSADSAPTAETWTGSVAIDAGVVSVKRSLSFDKNDSVSPRTDPKEVDFVSHTLPYVDGLFLRVLVPTGGSTLLHVKTTSLTTDIDLAQLPTTEGGVQRLASNPDEGLGWIGYKDVAGCRKGLVMGRWIKDTANFGELRGRVLAGDGDEDGFVRGIWGHSAKRDADVFIAKYIGPAGEDRGVTFGTYGDGTYKGAWGAADATTATVGTTSGIYSDGYDKGDGRGVWMGRWSETQCAE